MTRSKSGRCWFRFSVASLIWLMLCAAMVSFGYREHREAVRLQAQLRPPYVIIEEMHYFPPGPDYKRTRGAAAMKSYRGRRTSSGPLRPLTSSGESSP